MDRHNCTDTISGAALSSALPHSWHGWLEDGKNLLVADVKRAMTRMKFWIARDRSRRELAQLDDHLLADIGLTRDQAQIEAAKRFWEN